MEHTITTQDVPAYLKKSEFYKNIPNNDESFIVQDMHFKSDDSIDCMEDLFHLCHTLRFWIVEYEDFPFTTIFDFIMNYMETHKSIQLTSFYETFPELEIIQEIKLLVNEINKIHSVGDKIIKTNKQ